MIRSLWTEWRAKAHAILELPSQVEQLRATFADLRGELPSRTASYVAERLPRPEPPPFVCVWAWSTTGGEGPTTCGASHSFEPTQKECTLQMKAFRPLYDVQLICFADLRRVRFTGFFHGSDLITSDLGDCPVGRFRAWLPGELVRVTCERQ